MKKYSLIMMLMGLPLTGVSFAGFSVPTPMDVDMNAMSIDNIADQNEEDISGDSDDDQFERDKLIKRRGWFGTKTYQVETGGGEIQKERKALKEIKDRMRKEATKPQHLDYYKDFRLEKKSGGREMRRPGETIRAREFKREVNRILENVRGNLTPVGEKALADLRKAKEIRDFRWNQVKDTLNTLKERRASFERSEQVLKDALAAFEAYQAEVQEQRNAVVNLKSSIDKEETARQAYIANQNK